MTYWILQSTFFPEFHIVVEAEDEQSARLKVAIAIERLNSPLHWIDPRGSICEKEKSKEEIPDPEPDPVVMDPDKPVVFDEGKPAVMTKAKSKEVVA